MTKAMEEAREIYERGVNAGEQFTVVDEIATALAVRDAEIERLREALSDIDDLQVMEINPSNYDHDNVCELNANAVQASLIARRVRDGGKADG